MKSYLHYKMFFDIFGIKHLMNNQTKVTMAATMVALRTEHWPLHKVIIARISVSWSSKKRVVSRLRKPGLDSSNRTHDSEKDLLFKSYLTVDPNSIQFNFLRIQTCFTKYRSCCEHVFVILLKNLWRIHQRTPNTNAYKCEYRINISLNIGFGILHTKPVITIL